MFILKKDRKIKNALLLVTLFALATIIDANTTSNQNTQEAKLFGVEKTYGECTWVGGCGSSSSGTQYVKKKFKLFGVSVFDAGSGYESCSEPSNAPC